ncbi:MAG TPA: DUF2059 domain-containing protein [Silvibacterium sp.]|nr:DUF2059 domain-containing protein [Silvibacterium sp.]
MRASLFLLCIVLVVGVEPAHGDAASKDRKVRELLALMHLEQSNRSLVQAELDRIESQSRQQLAGVSLDPDQAESYVKFQRKVEALLRGSWNWKLVEPEFVKLYSDTYSEEELDGILAFYHSPVGQAMLAKTPELTAKSIDISRRRMAALAPKIQQLVDQFMAETR